MLAVLLAWEDETVFYGWGRPVSMGLRKEERKKTGRKSKERGREGDSIFVSAVFLRGERRREGEGGWLAGRKRGNERGKGKSEGSRGKRKKIGKVAA